MTAPSVIFGAVAKAADWQATEYNCTAPTGSTSKVVLPLALQYLTPGWVAFFGLGAVSAAVMSSTDSSMLSASTMIARNFYQKVIRPQAKEKEVIWALWVCICINCVIATSLAIEYRSIYDLFVLCGDFMFVIVFGQLTLVLFLPEANTYGSISSFVVSLTLRLLCGDKNMGIPPSISFGTIYGEPGSCPEAENEDLACEGQVPYRVIVTIIGIIVHLIVSYGTDFLFTQKVSPLDIDSYDFLGCFKYDKTTGKVVQARSRYMKHQQEEYQMETKGGAYRNDGYN